MPSIFCSSGIFLAFFFVFRVVLGRFSVFWAFCGTLGKLFFVPLAGCFVLPDEAQGDSRETFRSDNFFFRN